MAGIIDADTHISEGEAMWAMFDKDMYPRRPVLLKSPEDTLYGPRNAFWLIDGNIFYKCVCTEQPFQVNPANLPGYCNGK